MVRIAIQGTEIFEVVALQVDAVKVSIDDEKTAARATRCIKLGYQSDG